MADDNRTKAADSAPAGAIVYSQVANSGTNALLFMGALAAVAFFFLAKPTKRPRSTRRRRRR